MLELQRASPNKPRQLIHTFGPNSEREIEKAENFDSYAEPKSRTIWDEDWLSFPTKMRR